MRNGEHGAGACRAPSRSRRTDPLPPRAPRRRRSRLTRLRRPRVGRWAHERARGWAWWARIGQAGGGQGAGAPITKMLSAESTRRKRSEECTSGAQAPPPPRACCEHLRRPRFKRSQEVDCEMCAREGLGVRRRTRLPQHGMQLLRCSGATEKQAVVEEERRGPESRCVARPASTAALYTYFG